MVNTVCVRNLFAKLIRNKPIDARFKYKHLNGFRHYVKLVQLYLRDCFCVAAAPPARYRRHPRVAPEQQVQQ